MYEIKARIFLTKVESVFLYGSETWALTKSREKKIDGAYTRTLRTALNVSWREHITIKDLYGYLPNVSSKIRERRKRLAEHFVRHKRGEEALKLVIWQPQFNTDKLREDYLRPRTYTLCLRTLGSLVLENSERQS